MKLRNKIVRRLLILLSVVVVAGLLAGGAAVARLTYLHRVALHGKSAGLIAMKQGDYQVALKELGKYLSRNPDDADILLDYAKARQNVQEPNNENLGQAISLYQRALELRPKWTSAQRPLLDLYVEVNFNTEAIGLADKILTQDTSTTSDEEKTHALRCKIVGLMRMQRLDEAQSQMQQLVKRDPLNLEVRILELQIMLRKQSPDKIVAYTGKLATDHPDDPRFQLLRSIASSLAGDNKTAAELIRPLVNRPLPDLTYTRFLIRQLDAVQLFDDAFTVIQQTAKDSTDPSIKRMLITRLFETNQFDKVVDQTAGLDPALETSDVETLAMRVISLDRQGNNAQATELIGKLDVRGQGNAQAAKWAQVLRATTTSEKSDPVKNLQLLRDALAASPGSSLLEEDLAECLDDAGLRDKAMTTWRDVTRMSPEWCVPLVKVSQEMIISGQIAEALPVAKMALIRAPHDHDARVAEVTARAGILPAGASPEAEAVLGTIADIESTYPNDPDLLALKTSVLAQSGKRDEAVKTIRSALGEHPVPPERILMALAQISHSNKLDLEQECFDASQKAYGLTTTCVFARGMWLQEHQKNAEAMAMVQQAVAAHKDDDAVAWHTMWARFLEVSGDPRAKAEWVTLGDANPKTVTLQWDAVSARSVQTDHDFIGRTIDRLVSLLGDDSMSLHMLRAKWYLRGNSSESDVTQAAILLGEVNRSAPDMLSPRLLLASCYMRLGNVSGAIDQLASASDAQPQIAALAIQVARLMNSHGDFARSRQYIDRAVHSKQVNLQVAHEASAVLASQGDYPAALTVLENFYGPQKSLPADLMMASLYRQLNQPEKTDQICSALLQKPDGQSISFAADFYASQGQRDKAKAALAMLDSLKLPTETQSAILASYNARYGNQADAFSEFKAAAAAAPQDQGSWDRLVNFCFSVGKIDEGIAAADEAAKDLPKSLEFQVIHQNAEQLRQARNVEGVRPLLMSLGGDNAVNTPVLEAIRDLIVADQTHQTKDRTAGMLRQLADRNPRVLALQTVTLEFYIDANQVDEAMKLATRTVQAFPTAIEPVRAEANLYGSTARWDEALSAAKEWRRRDSADALDADVAIADAELQLGDLPAANQLIQPYLNGATVDPDKFSGVLLLRARGLIATHHPEQAEQLLRPLLPKSRRMRFLWMTLAVRSVEDQQRTQQWLQEVSSVLPDNADEKVALAQAWLAAGARWGDASSNQTGTTLLREVCQSPDAPIDGLLALGSCCEEAGDLSGAESAYRRALEKDKTNALACNNLASVLVTKGGDLNEAGQLAETAVNQYPHLSAFLDTRASVQAARKDTNGAISTLRQAEKFEPQVMKWRVNLLAVMTDSGLTRAAKTEMERIASDMPQFANTPPQVQQKYEALCSRLR